MVLPGKRYDETYCRLGRYASGKREQAAASCPTQTRPQRSPGLPTPFVLPRDRIVRLSVSRHFLNVAGRVRTRDCARRVGKDHTGRRHRQRTTVTAGRGRPTHAIEKSGRAPTGIEESGGSCPTGDWPAPRARGKPRSGRRPGCVPVCAYTIYVVTTPECPAAHQRQW